jgi:hypothetical protein
MYYRLAQPEREQGVVNPICLTSRYQSAEAVLMDKKGTCDTLPRLQQFYWLVIGSSTGLEPGEKEISTKVDDMRQKSGDQWCKVFGFMQSAAHQGPQL